MRQAQHAHALSTQTGVTDTRASLTVLAYLTAWLTEVEPGLRPATWRAYAIYIASHVGPTIGNLRLRELTAKQLNRLYAHLLQDGHARRDGGLSPKSVVNIHRMLHRALSSAVRNGVVDRGVLDHAQQPAPTTRPPAQAKTRLTGTAAEPDSSTSIDRAAATTVASLILRNAEGPTNGRESGRNHGSNGDVESEEPADLSRFRRSAGPSSGSGGRI